MNIPFNIYALLALNRTVLMLLADVYNMQRKRKIPESQSEEHREVP